MAEPQSASKLPFLKVGTGWVTVRVLSEPDVVLTFKGYTPVLRVRVEKTGLEYLLYIAAKSIAGKLEELRTSNGNRFTGLVFDFKKSSLERFATYEVRAAKS